MTRIALLLVTVVVLAGCGDKTLKSSELKDTIASQFKAQNIPLHDISCPDDIKAKTGAAIRCTGLNASDTKLVLEGKVTSVTDDKAHFAVKAVSGIAPGAAIAAQARKVLEQQVGAKAKGMTCPREVAIPTKPTVTCELTTLDGKRYDATVTISADAQLNVKVADTAKP
jgi:hypothetical protein